MAEFATFADWPSAANDDARQRANRIDALWWTWMILDEHHAREHARGRAMVADRLLELGEIP